MQAKKIGNILGIDVRFLKEEKKETTMKKADYITSSIDEEKLNLKVRGKEIVKEKKKHKIGRVVGNVAEGGSEAGGVISLSTGIARVATEEATSGILMTAGTGLKILGGGLIFLAVAVGAGIGGYLTHRHCEEMIEKFAKYYERNANSIALSYELANNYFDKID